MHLVDGFAHHRNGSVAVAAPGALPGGPQLGDRDQEENTFAQPDIAGLHHQVQPAVTVGRGVPTQQRDTQRVLGHAQCDIVAGSFGGLHRLLARAHRGVIGPKHAVLYRHTVGPGDDTGEGCRVLLCRAIATASWRSWRHPGRPSHHRAQPRNANATASGDPKPKPAPLAGSPAARSMTVCDHRKSSPNSPTSNQLMNATNANPTVKVGSPIDSSSAICSDASRDPSRERPA